MAPPPSRLISVKLVLICSFYCYMSELNHYLLSSQTSNLAHALLYHKYQPTPLLSRTNRQPHSQQQQQHLQQNFTSDSYYQNPQINYNRQQQQQQQQASQEQPQISYLRDSSDELDTYGCPSECHCNEIAHIADCSNRSLTRVPSTFPKDIKRIRLEINNITEIGPYAFQGLSRLQRIDLSQNRLYKIDPLAFSGGLQNLNSLILYSNKLEFLPANVFGELSRLQLLLLNANLLQAIQRDLFQSLTNLNLLSLHDNKIVTLSSGTFDGLKSIRTIHLGKNPLNCDCNLRWLVDYFATKPTVETSEARCEAPVRARDKKLRELNKSELKCQEQAVKTSPAPQAPESGLLSQLGACPAGCVCNGNTVDCSPLGQSTSESRTGAASGGLYELPDVPDDLPVYVARVHINDQRIKRIRQTGLFRKLANSQKLDLGNNRIVDVEDNAINGRLPNGQKPERVIFVLLENQHCDARQEGARGQSAPAASEDEAAPLDANQQLRSSQNGPRRPGQQQDAYQDDPCAMAPKVNEPQFDSPCYNGGACKAAMGSGANFTCQCPAGFGGSLCELNLDDCVDHQCQNGAMCVDGINSYKCICRDPTTSGEFCEQFNNKPHASNNLFNPPYATNSANSIAPLALPIIAAHQSASFQATNEIAQSSQQQHPHPQILARSADFLRMPDDLATNSLQVQPQQQQQQQQQSGKPPGSSACHRETTSKYYDDGNGCQSVRLLKMSECQGVCDADSPASGASCCAPTKIKRRRIHMQCNDGASYVKVIDLVKKCSCSHDSASCLAANNLDLFASGAAASSPTSTMTPLASSTTRSPPISAASGKNTSQYFKYSSPGDSAPASASGHQEKKRRQPQGSGQAHGGQRQPAYSASPEQDSLLHLDAIE